MATYTKLVLSGSTFGRLVKVAATATAGTLIHTAHASNLDEIHLFVVNSSTSSVKLTIEYGGVAAPDDLVEYLVPGEDGLHRVMPGLLLSNSLVVRAFAGTADVLMIGGFVNRIS